MKRIIITVAAALACMAASAQEKTGPWSLKECVDWALDHNISIRQSELQTRQREIDVNTAEGRRLPSLGASASQNFSFGRGLTADNTYANTNTTSTGFSLGTDVTIFNGFQITRNIEMSRLNLEAATADLEKAKNDVSLAVAQAYMQVLYKKEILGVALNQIQIDSVQVDRIQAMVDNGLASRADLAAQKATLAQSRLSGTQASNSLRLAVLDLTQLLELPSPDGFDVVSPDVDGINGGLIPSPDMIFEEALDVMPAIRAEQLRLDYASTNIALAKGGYYPSLSLSGGLGTNFYTSSGYPSAKFFDQVQNNFSQYVGLSMSIPIFNRYSTRNQVRSAQVSFANQELQLENARKSLYKEIQQVYYNAVASSEKLQSSALVLSSAEEAFELAREKYENGKAGITEFNEAKARYISASSDELQAKYEHLYQTALVNFYRGKELFAR